MRTLFARAARQPLGMNLIGGTLGEVELRGGEGEGCEEVWDGVTWKQGFPRDLQ